jgi:ribonuclease-3
MRPAAALAARLGLEVRDLDLVEQALVHSSYQHEHPDRTVAHNERLEFLGDAVISLVISEALFTRHPADDEGTLSARRAAIVSTVGLARLAGRIELGDRLLLGEGESQRGGRRRPSLLASGLEALAGALYLDLGYATTRDWLIGLATPEIEADLPMGTLKSAKSRLQEHTQQRSGKRPLYRIVEASGPDHAKMFRIEVLVDDSVIGVGEGLSRRIAETAAAAAALEAILGDGPRDEPSPAGEPQTASPAAPDGGPA